jgi:hypothetical protein
MEAKDVEASTTGDSDTREQGLLGSCYKCSS